MKKTILALSMIIILNVTVLAGCSSNEAGTTTEPTQEETTVEEATKDEVPNTDGEIADLSELFKKGATTFKGGIYYAQTFTMTDQQSQMKTWQKGDKIKNADLKHCTGGAEDPAERGEYCPHLRGNRRTAASGGADGVYHR